jgi:competence protein ComEC
VILAVLGPIGLDQPAVWMIDYGARFILWVAGWIAAMPGAVSAVITPPDLVLPLMALGGIFVMLWKGQARWGGFALPLAAIVLWFGADRPVLLVADTGGLVGLMTTEGRVLSKATGDGYVAENWLENDGETVLQAAAHARPGMVTEARVTRISLQGAEVLHVTGKVALAGITGCGGADVLIANVVAEPGTLRDCDVFDLARLRMTGALAASMHEGAFSLVTAADLAGDRLWTR